MVRRIDTEARIERIRLENQASSPASPTVGYSQIYSMTTGSMRGLYIEHASGQYDPLISSYPFDGRLTVTGSNPVSTTDISAAGKLFYTPYVGNRLTLLDTNGSPEIHTFKELEWSVSTSGTATYDAFVYDNAGTLTLEIVGWTSPISRATALVRSNGILVKSGDITRSYLGTFYSKVANQIDDTLILRGLWNYYSRVHKPLGKFDVGSSHTYNTATWRSWNNSTSNRLEVIVGVAEDSVGFNLVTKISTSNVASSGLTGIGYDSTSSPVTSGAANASVPLTNAIQWGTSIEHPIGLGYHFYQVLEKGAGADTQTFALYYFNGVIKG